MTMTINTSLWGIGLRLIQGEPNVKQSVFLIVVGKGTNKKCNDFVMPFHEFVVCFLLYQFAVSFKKCLFHAYACVLLSLNLEIARCYGGRPRKLPLKCMKKANIWSISVHLSEYVKPERLILLSGGL